MGKLAKNTKRRSAYIIFYTHRADLCITATKEESEHDLLYFLWLCIILCSVVAVKAPSTPTIRLAFQHSSVLPLRFNAENVVERN